MGWHSGTNQEWTATQNSDGTWQLKNVASGLCMDVRHASGSAGAAVIQWTCTGAANQRWRVVSRGGVSTLTSAGSGMAVTEASTSNDAALTQQPYTGAATQNYTFTKVG